MKGALFTCRFLIILRLSSFLVLSLYSLFIVFKDFLEGKALLLLIGGHWEAKKLLKRLALSLKFNTNLIFFNSIYGILLLKNY